MAKIPESFNFRSKENMGVEDLILVLERMYIDLAESINRKPDLYQRETDGQINDTFLPQGSININLLTDKVEMLTNHVNPNTVSWTTLS